MTVYGYVVFLLNFLVDFLLLAGAAPMAGYPPNVKRTALGALMGASYAAFCLYPGFGFLGNLFWRIVSLGVISMISFGLNRTALQPGMIFALLTLALERIAAGAGKHNAMVLLLCAVLLWLLCNVHFRSGLGRSEYVPVELSWNGKKVRLLALRDSGNMLRDPVTGEQVLVAGADVAAELLGLTPYQLQHPVQTVGSEVLQGLRLIPFRAVGQPGSMMIGLRIRDAKIGDRRMDPVVAFAPEEIARGEVYRMLTGGTI